MLLRCSVELIIEFFEIGKDPAFLVVSLEHLSCVTALWRLPLVGCFLLEGCLDVDSAIHRVVHYVVWKIALVRLALVRLLTLAGEILLVVFTCLK